MQTIVLNSVISYNCVIEVVGSLTLSMVAVALKSPSVVKVLAVKG